MGPSAIRIADLEKRLEELGHKVEDYGDLDEEEDDDWDDDWDDEALDEPIGSCDVCGCNLYAEDIGGLCNQCEWQRDQFGVTDRGTD